MPRKEHKKAYVIGIIIVTGLFIAGLASFALFGARFISYFEYRYDDSLYPTPNHRELMDSDALTETFYSTYGYSVRLPWKNVLNEIDTEHLAGLVFKSGQVFQVHHPAKVVDWHTELNKDKNNFIIKKLKKAFGPGCCSTNHHIVSLILNASPEDLSLFQSAAKSEAIRILMTYKGMYIPENPKKLFYYKTRHLKAFQVGDPAEDDTIKLIIFPDDTTELIIDIHAGKEKLRQAQVDQVVNTFKRESN